MKQFIQSFVTRLIAAGLLFATVGHAAETGKRVSLFDGKTMNGWEGDPALWRVQDGTLTGGSESEQMARNVFLASTADYTNFVVHFQIKLTGKEGFINSGIQIRSQRVPNSTEMSGYQCDYGDPTWWGCIYDESRRNKVLSPSDMTALGPVIKRQDWNDYVIRAQGPHITTWINGVMGTDYIETDPAIPQFGKFGVQVHGGGKAMVQIRDVYIEELPEPAPNSIFLGSPVPPKAAQVQPQTPEQERASFTLPPGFDIELVTSEVEGVGKPVTVVWDQKGRMWTMTALEYPVDANENPEQAKALFASHARDRVLVFDHPYAPGPLKPRVFADGLAMPLGLLPYHNGIYVQNGPEVLFLDDTDGDGKADQRKVVLGNFGIQDSHLFPHQFTRAPGGWIWLAQGAFNSGKVRTTTGQEVQFDATRMARFRLDGSVFEPTCQGPCNIWGLVLNGEGEAFIQEANDYGFPVMPFHQFANYPGCSDRLFKSYAPEFPGTAPDFRMGGTGLSGLALSDKQGSFPGAYADVMYVANPITRKVQAIKIHRDGPRYRLQLLPDFIQSSDEMFRPVSIHFGPDGCLYVVDWYNKIISHNEVPRNHPDRDKTHGRIWRIKQHDQQPRSVPDFTTVPETELLAKLGGDSLIQSHLAWQAIIDRKATGLVPALRKNIADASLPAARRIESLWALEGLETIDASLLTPLLQDTNRNVRREAVQALGNNVRNITDLFHTLESLVNDPDPEVRAEVIRTVGPRVAEDAKAVALCLAFAREPLDAPLAPATRNGKPIKVREAYDREFERFLVRLHLEQQPQAVAAYLSSAAANTLPVENRLVATLSLEPRTSAEAVAKLLPQLSRTPGQEEILRLAQFPTAPGVLDTLRTLLASPKSQRPVLDALLAIRQRIDSAPLKPLLTETARSLFGGDDAARALSLQLAGAFQLQDLEADLLAILNGQESGERQLGALRALRELGSNRAELFAKLARSARDPLVRDEAVNALAAAKSDQAGPLLLTLWPDLSAGQRRNALARLTSTQTGAHAVVHAVRTGTFARNDLDGATVERLQAVLGNDTELAALMQDLHDLFHPVLVFDGTDNAYVDTDFTLDGPFTVETWIRLAPGIDNKDGILGSPGQLDINFYASRLRVWVGGDVHDAIVAKKPMTPDLWTHVAVTRDAQGHFKLYLDGSLDTDQSKAVPQKFEHCKIAWTQPKGGLEGALSEYRLWNRALTEDEIRTGFDRSLEGQPKPTGLVFYAPGAGPWGNLHSGSQIVKTSDYPPLVSAQEAKELDEKFAKFRTLANQSGNAVHGKTVADVCRTCHLIQGQGGNIGPNISGAGAMGVEALLRNIITPNAAMEAGYRTYRVELKDGDLIDAFFVSEDSKAIIVRQPGSEDRRIAKKDVRRSGFIRRSLMPEGLLEAMPPQDVSDLFAYLKTLK